MNIKSIEIKGTKYEYIGLIKLFENNEFDKNFNIITDFCSYNLFIKGLFYCYILKTPITIKVEELNISEIIYSSQDVDEFIKNNSLNKRGLLIVKNNKYYDFSKNQNYLYSYIENNYIKLMIKDNEISIIKAKTPLNIKKDLIPDEMSKYFYEYFKYNDIKNRKNNFQYETSYTRQFILHNIVRLLQTEVQHYKITGPTSNGKSTTLFIICCTNQNFIYFNLKALKKCLDEKKEMKFIDMIVTECGRLNLQQEDIDELNKFIQENKLLKYFDFFYNFLKKLSEISIKKEERIILMFDQFKKKNYESLPEFESMIERILFANKNMKVVYCSSINNDNIREEILKNPDLTEIYLTQNSENYYFYYPKIYDIKIKDSNPLYEMFNYLPKYIFLLKQNGENQYLETINTIKDKIYEKIENFESNNIQKFLSNNLNKSNYYSFLNKTQNTKISINDIKKIIGVFPLKYFIIEFDTTHFIMKPIFPFISEVLESGISKNESDEYFKNSKYKENFQTCRIKADYFEEACKNAIKDDKIFKIPDDNFQIIKLEEISSMKKIYKSTLDIINEILGKKGCANLNEKKYKTEDIKMHILFSNESKQKLFFNNVASEEIREAFFPLEYFREKEYKERINELKEQGNSNFSGEENFIIDQKSQFGQCIDFALLFGEKMKKIFVGFQIKCFDPYANHTLTEITKYKIKNKLKEILLNSFILFNSKIVEWHYVLILYLNREDFNNSTMNKDVISHCKRNNIFFMYYDPKNKRFYDNDGKNIIDQLIINDITNLDITRINQYNYVAYDCEINDSFKLINYDIILEEINKFVQEFAFIGLRNLKQCDEKMELILDYFETIFGKKFEYCGRFEILKDKEQFHSFPLPLENILVIIKGKSNEFIGIFHHNGKYVVKNMNNKKSIKYSEVNLKFEEEYRYYYCFNVIDGRYKRNILGIEDNDINSPFIGEKEGKINIK